MTAPYLVPGICTLAPIRMEVAPHGTASALPIRIKISPIFWCRLRERWYFVRLIGQFGFFQKSGNWTCKLQHCYTQGDKHDSGAGQGWRDTRVWELVERISWKHLKPKGMMKNYVHKRYQQSLYHLFQVNGGNTHRNNVFFSLIESFGKFVGS